MSGEESITCVPIRFSYAAHPLLPRPFLERASFPKEPFLLLLLLRRQSVRTRVRPWGIAVGRDFGREALLPGRCHIHIRVEEDKEDEGDGDAHGDIPRPAPASGRGKRHLFTDLLYSVSFHPPIGGNCFQFRPLCVFFLLGSNHFLHFLASW